MVRRVVGLIAFSITLFVCPQVASAQWYVSPYVGKVFNLEHPFGEFTFGAPTNDKPTVIGVSGGTSPLGRLGFEIDFQKINNMFRTGDTEFDENGEQIIGPNDVRSITAVVHYGRPIPQGGATRFRPYGVFGGGLNIINLGQERRVDLDFEFLNTLPPAQQIARLNCLNAQPPTATLAQVSAACGIPLLEEVDPEKMVGYRGILTAGGGVTVKLASHVAARFDVRYFFMSIPKEDTGTFRFWRVTVGVVLHR